MKLENITIYSYKVTPYIKSQIKAELIKQNITLLDLAKINGLKYNALVKRLSKGRTITAEWFNEVFKPINIYIDDKTHKIRHRRTAQNGK